MTDMSILAMQGGLSVDSDSYYCAVQDGNIANWKYVTGTTTNVTGDWQYMHEEPYCPDCISIMSPFSVTPVLERCKYCGIKHKHDDKFCEGCGAPL